MQQQQATIVRPKPTQIAVPVRPSPIQPLDLDVYHRNQRSVNKTTNLGEYQVLLQQHERRVNAASQAIVEPLGSQSYREFCRQDKPDAYPDTLAHHSAAQDLAQNFQRRNLILEAYRKAIEDTPASTSAEAFVSPSQRPPVSKNRRSTPLTVTVATPTTSTSTFETPPPSPFETSQSLDDILEISIENEIELLASDNDDSNSNNNERSASLLEEDLQLSDSADDIEPCEVVEAVLGSSTPVVDTVAPAEQLQEPSAEPLPVTEPSPVSEPVPTARKPAVPAIKNRSRLPSALLKASSPSDATARNKRFDAIRKRAQSNWERSRQTSFTLPRVAPPPKKPLSPTFARFNPGLSCQYPQTKLPSAHTVIVNNYYGTATAPTSHQPPPQQADPLQMSRGQFQRFCKKVPKETAQFYATLRRQNKDQKD